jgi:hypothetical protein
MIKWFLSLFSDNGMSYQQRQYERYLAASADLVDLERRQKEITYGKYKV